MFTFTFRLYGLVRECVFFGRGSRAAGDFSSFMFVPVVLWCVPAFLSGRFRGNFGPGRFGCIWGGDLLVPV